MLECTVGSNDSNERSFSRIDGHSERRGNAEDVVCALARADALEIAGDNVRRSRTSRNYDTSVASVKRATTWNDGGGVRMHAQIWVHGGDFANFVPKDVAERTAYAQMKARARSAKRAARGSDMTTRMFHKRYSMPMTQNV
ncbi:hypothetical protein RI054_24g104030 [Pseudoscourfieldia marina]